MSPDPQAETGRRVFCDAAGRPVYRLTDTSAATRREKRTR